VIFFPNFKKKKKNSSHLNSDFCLVAFWELVFLLI
jgi:hypothetical protein